MIQFSQPISGFREHRRFVLINDSNMGDGTCWLQSVEEKQAYFIMLNPLEIKPGYTSAVSDEILDQLETEPEDELDRWVLLAIGRAFQQSAANLKSPTIVNHKANLVVQMVLDQNCTIRQLVPGEDEVDVC